MKLSFSTNGWNEFTWRDFYSMAKDLGFSGIEVHNISEGLFEGRNAPFIKSELPKTSRKLRELGLSVPCFDAVCNIADASKLTENCIDTEDYIYIASSLGTPYIRIYASQQEGKTPEEEDDAVVEYLKKMIPIAEKADVVLLIETVGIYADTSRLCDILNFFASDNLAALWDMHHPYRRFGESAEKTIQNLGAYIRHVHVKDSVVIDGKVRFRLMGEGDIPFDEMMSALRSVNYDGFISFEWKPLWLEELSDSAIVFPHFLNYMSRYISEEKDSGKTFSNKDGSGKYIWKKDTLIDSTFSQVLDRIASEFPDQYAFKYTTLDYTRTYAEFRDDVDTFSRSLIALGVKPGDHVAVWATNVPQWFIAFWATTKIGAVLVTVNTAYKIHEAEYLLRQSDTHTLILIDSAVDSDYIAIINEICPELKSSVAGQPLHCRRLPFLRNVITIQSRRDGCLTWDDAMALAYNVPIEEVYRRASAVDKNDVCNMQYTSGTTGFPKGVMLTHYNVVNNGKCIGDRMDFSTADRLLIQVPMFHCFGMVLAMTAAVTHGTTMCPIPYFSAKTSLACVNLERITACHGVPTMFIAMLEHEDYVKTDFSYLRTGIMAGSVCPEPLMRDVVEKLNMYGITSVYGQTEASPGCTMSDWEDPLDLRVGTVGRVFPNVECKIIDPETGKDLPDGENGELVVRGYNIMKGYYKMPQATEAAIDSDGWLHTGDIACRTPDGYYRITGRLRDMIIRGGENIYPKEIEEFIYTHPKVSDVQVIGVPDEQYGEEIMACVILKEGECLSEDELKKFVRDHMARHKIPKYVEFVSSFPMNVAGKILKYKMREAAIEKLGLNKPEDS
ncbi:MAG: AMP-binding protein [Clostridiales bacterium]|jgi:fatty-acyl-CoA synthase|nr:AMP-binding protein [Clostridiales bacterium]